MPAAIGAGTLFGQKLEEPSDVYSVGHPIPASAAAAIAAPGAAPTTAASVGAGNITGTVEHRYAYIKAGGFVSVPSAWSTPLVLSAKNAELSVIANSADAGVIGKVIERRVGSIRCIVGYIWNNTTTTFIDSLSTTSASLDFSARLNELGETGVNGEFKYPLVESGDPSIEPKTITAAVITSGAGNPKGRPGPVGISVGVKGTANAGELVEYLLTCGLDCTKYGVKAAAFTTTLTDVDEPTRKYVFKPKRAGRLGKGSLSIHNHGGGDSVNGFIWQTKAEEVVVKTDGGKVATMETKLIGCGYTPHGLPTVSLDAGSPTALTLPVLFGRRADAAADTAVTMVKCSTGPSAGSYAVKAKDSASATYHVSSAQTVLYNTTSKKQSQQTGMFSDKLRLVDQNGVPMGLGSGRPLMYVHGGDSTLIEANDEYTFPAKPLAPDTGTTPGTPDSTSTGFGPKRYSSPDFTDANAFVTDNGTGLLVTATQIKIVDPKKLIEGHGIESGYGYDVQDTGKKDVEFQFTRYYEDLSYQKRQELLVRPAFVWKLEGDLILVTPGTYSAQRETIMVELPETEIKSAKPTSGGADVRMETVTVGTVEPTDGSDAFTITIITREDVPIPA